MSAVEVNQASFEAEVLQSDIPVLADLWAPWCGPCKAIGPTVEDIAREYEGRIKVVKINIDESPKIATDYGVMSIPTLLIFKQGRVEAQLIGLVSKSKIIEKFSGLL